jgi:hypothetical protein
MDFNFQQLSMFVFLVFHKIVLIESRLSFSEYTSM